MGEEEIYFLQWIFTDLITKMLCDIFLEFWFRKENVQWQDNKNSGAEYASRSKIFDRLPVEIQMSIRNQQPKEWTINTLIFVLQTSDVEILDDKGCLSKVNTLSDLRKQAQHAIHDMPFVSTVLTVRKIAKEVNSSSQDELDSQIWAFIHEHPDLEARLDQNDYMDTSCPVSIGHENWTRLVVLVVDFGSACLRKKFIQLWFQFTKHEWDEGSFCHPYYDDKTCGLYCHDVLNLSKKSSYPEQTLKVKDGRIAEWDIPLIAKVIKALRIKFGADKDDVTWKGVQELKELRNYLLHLPAARISAEQFQVRLKQSRNTLIMLGVSVDEVDRQWNDIISSKEAALLKRYEVVKEEVEKLNFEVLRLRKLGRKMKRALEASEQDIVSAISSLSLHKAEHFKPCQVPSGINKVSRAIAIAALPNSDLSFLDTFASDGDQDKVEEIAKPTDITAIYSCNAVETATRDVQLLEAFVLKHARFEETREFSQLTSDIQQHRHEFLGMGLQETVSSAGVISILNFLIENGVDLAKYQKMWNTVREYVSSSEMFQAKVIDMAKEGAFQVEYMVECSSYVAFVRIRESCRELVHDILDSLQRSGNKDFRELMDRSGTQCVLFFGSPFGGAVIMNDSIQKDRILDTARICNELLFKTSHSSVDERTANASKHVPAEELKHSVLSSHTDEAEFYFETESQISAADTVQAQQLLDPFELRTRIFASYVEALKECFYVLGKSEVHVSEIKSLFAKYEIKIGGKNQKNLQPVLGIEEMTTSHTGKSNKRVTRSELSLQERVFYNKLHLHLKRMNAECANPDEKRTWERRWRYESANLPILGDTAQTLISHRTFADEIYAGHQASSTKQSQSTVVVQSPLLDVLKQIQAIANNIKDLKTPTIISPADCIDLNSLQEIINDARANLRTKASQRITVLGQSGVGKSTTLNMLLGATQVLDDDYPGLYYNQMNKAGNRKFYQTLYLADEDSDSSKIAESKISLAVLSEEESERIAQECKAREYEIRKDMRDLIGERLDADDHSEKMRRILSSDWDFMLPAGSTSGGGGVTAHVFNLRFGPCALRVMTKSKQEVQESLFTLSQMLKHSLREEMVWSRETGHGRDSPTDMARGREAQGTDPGGDSPTDTVRAPVALHPMRLREPGNIKDRAWENKIHAFQKMCLELGLYKPQDGLDEVSGLHELVKEWKTCNDVPIPKGLADHLDKVMVYVGNGKNVTVDRVHIREILRSWVSGNNSECKPDEENFKLHHVLEAFDLWLPCTLLDEFCCLSDIPGSFDGNPATTHLMSESLRRSKSVLCFIDSSRGFPQVVSDPLAESGILKSFLDAPTEYRIILLDVPEKRTESGPGRGTAVKLLPSKDWRAKTKDRTENILRDFETSTERAISSRRLWPHLCALEQAEDEPEEDSLAAVVGRDKVNSYLLKLPVAKDETKHFSIFPVTFHALCDLEPQQVMDVLTMDPKRSEAAAQNLAIKDLKYLTNVPRLIDELRSVLVDGSVEVKNALRDQLEKYRKQLRIPVLGSSDSAWSDFAVVVKRKADEIASEKRVLRARKGIDAAQLQYQSTCDIGRALQNLYLELNKQHTALMQTILDKNGKTVTTKVSKRFSEFVKALKLRKRNILHVITQDPEESAVLPLLHLVYKDLLDFEAFSEQWKRLNDIMRSTAVQHLQEVRDMIAKSYNDFFSASSLITFFKEYIDSRVNLTMNLIEARVMKRLSDYERSFYNRQKGGLWGMRPAIYSNSQKILFSKLDKRQRSDQAAVEAAIKENMLSAANQGIMAVFEIPSRTLESLLFTDVGCGEECRKLREHVHSMFDKSVKQLSSCSKDQDGFKTHLKTHVESFDSKLQKICDALAKVGCDNLRVKYDSPLRSVVDQDPDQVSIFDEIFEYGQSQEIDFSACPHPPKDIQKAHQYIPYTESELEKIHADNEAFGVGKIDPKGLYRSLSVCLFRNDSIVSDLCRKLGEYAIETLVKTGLVHANSVFLQFFGKSVGTEKVEPLGDEKAISLFAEVFLVDVWLYDTEGLNPPEIFKPSRQDPCSFAKTRTRLHIARNGSAFTCLIPIFDESVIGGDDMDDDTVGGESKRPKTALPDVPEESARGGSGGDDSDDDAAGSPSKRPKTALPDVPEGSGRGLGGDDDIDDATAGSANKRLETGSTEAPRDSAGPLKSCCVA